MSRRCGSAIALKTSDVVAARAMPANVYPYGHVSSHEEAHGSCRTTSATPVSGCGERVSRGSHGRPRREGDGRAARHRLVADATGGVIASPMSGRDIG